MERNYSKTIQANVKIPLSLLFALVKFLKPIYENIKGREHVSCADPFAKSSYENLCGLPPDILDIVRKHVQILKTHTMLWGDFHQRFIGSIEGWKNLKQGHPSKLDIMHEKDKNIAEVKNNENTMNDDSKKTVYDKLVKAIADGWNAFLVIINGCVENKILSNGIRQISGRDFYAKITGILSFYDDLDATIDWLTATYPTFEKLLEACSISEHELADVIDANADLSGLTCNDLKEVIKSINLTASKKLPMSGSKTVLIERIKKHRGGTS